MKRRSEISIYIYDGVRGAMLYTDARVVYGRERCGGALRFQEMYFFFAFLFSLLVNTQAS